MKSLIIKKNSSTPHLCSPRRWLISAAHCFCGTVVKCTGDSTVKKVFDGEDFDNSKIKISQEEAAKVSKLVIHPNYFSFTGNTVVGNTDLALLKMDQDLFQVADGKVQGKMSPICLPAKLGFRVDQNQTKEGIHQPFEDLDCFLIECKMVSWC